MSPESIILFNSRKETEKKMSETYEKRLIEMIFEGEMPYNSMENEK